MIKPLFIFTLALATLHLQAQNFKVLHYTETSGYDHQTRQSSLAMFQALGQQYNFAVDDDQMGAGFDSLSKLQEYAVVVFSNTSGDQILDSAQRANFEAYMLSGGSLLGIHAASDTYRHSSANGSNTGSWDWYAAILGGSVQQNPNHTAANHTDTLDVIGQHYSTQNLPNPWVKTEEYYYWENGYLNNSNIPVLQVRTTGTNSYDTPRPMSWHKTLFGGGRSFYTALGHASSNFTSDTLFRNHIRDALLWAAHQTSGTGIENTQSSFSLYPVPARNELVIEGMAAGSFSYQLFNTGMQKLNEGTLDFTSGTAALNTSDLQPGYYFLKVTGSSAEVLRFVVE